MEQLLVGFKLNQRAILGALRGSRGFIAQQYAFLELSPACLAVAEALRHEMQTQRIHRLQAHAVQTHTFLENLRVILTAGVQHRHGLHQFAQGDATTIVAHTNAQVLVQRHLYALAGIHLELVYTIVYHLFQQYIDTVLRMRPIAQLANIHAWAGPHMLHIRQVPDIVVIINHFLLFDFFFCHRKCILKIGN